MKILVMANGRGNRWNPGDFSNWTPPCLYKQWVQVGRYPNITRTVVMCNQIASIRPTVIAPEEYRPYVQPEADLYSLPEQSGHLHQGIVETYRLWKGNEQIAFLYGDVIYEWEVLRTMLSENTEQVKFIGRDNPNRFTGKACGEIFGISVPGKLNQEFYTRMYEGWQEHRPRIWGYTYKEGFVEMDTYTDDVDSPEEFRAFYPRLVYHAVRDDLKNMKF